MLTPEEQSLRVVAKAAQVLVGPDGCIVILEGMAGTVKSVKPMVDDEGRQGTRVEVLWDFGVRRGPPDAVDTPPEVVTRKIHTDAVVASVHQLNADPADIRAAYGPLKSLEEKIESACRSRAESW